MNRSQPESLVRSQAIISPWVDTLCVGGGSIVVLLGLLLFGDRSLIAASPNIAWWMDPVKALLTVTINMPHFLASYRIIYRTRERILKYKAATIYVPAFILSYALFAIVMAREDLIWITLLMLVAGGYLAWHYTGQAWGMMATFARLSGNPFEQREVKLIRASLRILLVWHVVWFLYWQNQLESARHKLLPFYVLVTLSTVLALILGIAGLVLYRRRIGRFPEIRVVLPWLAICVWYVALSQHPGAIFWVQIAHGLQYLIFPLRVEANEFNRREHPAPNRLWRHMAAYGFVSIGLGFLIVEYAPKITEVVGAAWMGDQVSYASMMTPLAFLNIHHYFTDGCIWKLRDPQVRQDLFGHLPDMGGPGGKK